jgi:SAM-dependent methyltransferase
VDEVIAVSQAVDEKVEQVFQAVLGGVEAISIAIGDRLGYFRALDGKDLTSRELAEVTGCSERYTREWLEQQAVCGYLDVVSGGDAHSRRFTLAPGTAEVLARPDELTTMAPLTRILAAAAAQWTRIAEGARTGAGLGWREYGDDMREGQADVNGPPLRRLLPDEWLRAAVPEVHRRLEDGEPLNIADVGCGAGWASIGLAARFAEARVDAFDVDPPTVDLARRNVDAAGLGDRVQVFQRDVAEAMPSPDYDLTLAVECVHDMPHPVPVLAAMREMTKPTGAVLVVDEKVADEFTAPGDDVERLMYGYSTLVCLPDGMSGNPTGATGTVIRRPIMERYAREAGFRSCETLPVEHDVFRFYRLS